MMFSVLARILFFASMWKLLHAYNRSIEIQRRDIKYTNGEWTYQADIFKIPSTMCSSDISVYCGVMGGHSIGGCKCECNSERTTFGFYNDQWNCTANSKVHQHAGCSLILLSERTEDSALITVPLSMQDDIPYEMPTVHQRCYIIPYNSTYLLCDGSWKTLNNNFVFNNRFSMAERENKQFFIFDRTKGDFWYNEVKGKILRMSIGCYNKSNAIISDCLLLKMQGTMTCPQFFLPPLHKAPKSPWTISPTSATGTNANELQTHQYNISISQPSTMESPNFIHKRKENVAEENDGGNTGLIIGVAVGVIGLTLIIIAIVLVKRKRTKRNAAVAKSNTTVENVSYEIGVDNSLKITNCDGHRSLDQDEYSYAYANAAPPTRRNMSNNRPNPGPQITVSNHVYGKVQDLHKHGSTSHVGAAPIYNTIEEPEYAKIDESRKTKASAEDHNEPFYNVLEGPETDDSAPEGLWDEPPCYHVLEGPFSEGSLVYDVLEGPESDKAPVYGSLKGQDPHVYGVLNMPEG